MLSAGRCARATLLRRPASCTVACDSSPEWSEAGYDKLSRVEVFGAAGIGRPAAIEVVLVNVVLKMGEDDPCRGEMVQVLCGVRQWERLLRDDLGSRGINRRDALTLVLNKIKWSDLSRERMCVTRAV